MNEIMVNKKYSVLMSVYAGEKSSNLEHALDSIISQTIMPDEIVLVKDGPQTNEIEQVIKKYSNKYNNIFTIVINEKNEGLGVSLSRGLCHCRNEFVARMDTDDIALPERCENQIDFLLANPSVSIVGGQIDEFVNTEDNIVGRRTVPCSHEEIRKYMKKRCPFNHMTVMFRKQKVISVGNYIDCFWNEDYYLWIRMELAKCIFANLPEVLVRVRTNTETYQRRGGRNYFKSEVFLQKFMLREKIISAPRYLLNVTIRFVIQILLPNKIRYRFFKLFAREKYRAVETK